MSKCNFYKNLFIFSLTIFVLYFVFIFKYVYQIFKLTEHLKYVNFMRNMIGGGLPLLMLFTCGLILSYYIKYKTVKT